MRRISAGGQFVLFLGCTTAVYADPMFSINISGDGHTIQFLTPNPLNEYDIPDNIIGFLSGPGSIDGVSGTVEAEVLLAGNLSGFTLGVDLENQTASNAYLYGGPPITKETWVPVAYNPVYPEGGAATNYLIESAFVPGAYTFHNFTGFCCTPVAVTITEESASGVTSEPSAWVLLATGAIGGVGAVRRRWRARAG